MAIRRLLQASVPKSRVSAVAAEVCRRFGDPSEAVEVERLDADNWLSVPCVVNERWFVKIIAEQHTFVHALLTTGRNIGAFSSGTEGFFERFSTPIEMAEHELDATAHIRELGIAAPEPIEAFEFEGVGVLVLEYLAAFRTLDELSADAVRSFAPTLFSNLASMHEAGLAHGDLRAENVLVAPNADGVETLYFIDATRVSDEAIGDAKVYDIACALASLEPHIGVSSAVEAALESYSADVLLEARDFLDFVGLRPDHGFDTAALKGEIEKVAT
ncbi:MAG: lipopolysaccharide kinase InaA family protein [Natronomonas sp.]|uniref:lipopolysaccharide kinase InaA family protein n=1 Tax=Natronomonas sp. TaxID=2184060 RepID=UPI002870A057|nr:lipopolysaccharide kinase InaA family protein [Natronomonas sp.]MDR9430680.1 lipopolysaccharide kinase InaA family protein [Natronomonas sp.]